MPAGLVDRIGRIAALRVAIGFQNRGAGPPAGRSPRHEQSEISDAHRAAAFRSAGGRPSSRTRHEVRRLVPTRGIPKPDLVHAAGRGVLHHLGRWWLRQPRPDDRHSRGLGSSRPEPAPDRRTRRCRSRDRRYERSALARRSPWSRWRPSSAPARSWASSAVLGGLTAAAWREAPATAVAPPRRRPVRLAPRRAGQDVEARSRRQRPPSNL